MDEGRVDVMRVGGGVVAVVLFLLATWLGAESFAGTFGVTDTRISCGSVWHLPWEGDLNAASCRDELRGRLTVTAGLVGASIAVAGVTAWPCRAGWLLVVGLVIGLGMVAYGRHLIWRVSGA